MADAAFAPRSAFAALAPSTASTGGVFVTDLDGLGLATVLARKGQSDALAARVRERYGIELPQGPRRAAARDVAFIGVGPGAWLATLERGANALAAELQEALAGVASVCDQSDGYAALRLSGSHVRESLLKLVSIDLHPRAFQIGDAAATLASHIAITLWCLDDDSEGHAVFELTLFRSMAESFWHALSSSAAEFGLVVLRQDQGGVRPDRELGATGHAVLS